MYTCISKFIHVPVHCLTHLLQFPVNALEDCPLLSEVVDHHPQFCVGGQRAVEANQSFVQPVLHHSDLLLHRYVLLLAHV